MQVRVVEGLQAGHGSPGREAHVEEGAAVHHAQQAEEQPLLPALGHRRVVAAAGLSRRQEPLLVVRKHVVGLAQGEVEVRRIAARQERAELTGAEDRQLLVGLRPVLQPEQGVLPRYLNNKTGKTQPLSL